MHYLGKHRSATSASALRRLAVTVIGGATVIGGGMAAAPSASAAPVQTVVSSSVWDRVAACESGGNWKIATGNGYYGGLQFSASSWRAAGGTRYASLPHRATKGQQIAAAQNLLRMQGPGAWPQCGPRAGLTRSSGLSGGSAVSTASRSKARVNKARVVKHGSMTRAQIRKLQRLVGARVDGIMGRETVRKTERYLHLRHTGHSYLSGSSLRGAHRLV